MFNKNLVLALVVVALLVGGILFALNKNSVSNTNSPSAVSGELTREMARQVILDYYDKEPDYDNFQVKVLTITGITMESPTKALVNFDVEGEESGKLVKESSPIAMPFTLYDDGWRIDFTRYTN